MFEKIYDSLNKLISNQSFSNKNEIYLYLILHVAALFSGSMHIFLLIIFWCLNVPALAILNLISILIYAAITIRFVRRKAYVAAGLSISIEVIVYSIVSSIFLGTESYSILYFFVILSMQLIIPYASVKFRGLVTLAVWFSVMMVLAIGFVMPPIISLGQMMWVLSIFNINLAFFGIMIELSVGTFIQNTIGRYNKKRLIDYKYQAHTDSLTGLYNRRYAEVVFERIKNENPRREWCVALLDIDDFKQINDKNGHAVGDEVLCTLAGYMQSHFRKTDYLFRWGGEEFLILLADASGGDSREVLEKLRIKLCSGPIKAKGVKIKYSVTIGIAQLDLDDIEGSIKRSDDNLYIGKKYGKNQMVGF